MDMTSPQKVLLDVWTDYVCPFCFIQLEVIDRFLADAPVPIDIRWHAFELRPEPIPLIAPDGDYLKDIWVKAVYPLAAERRIKIRMPSVAPRSRKAFELAFYSKTVGRFDEVHRRLFNAYFVDDRDIGNEEILFSLAADWGLHKDTVKTVFAGRSFEPAIVDDEAAAGRLGVTGLPFAMFSRVRPGVSETAPVVVRGAAPLEHFSLAIERLLSQDEHQ